jgi:ubiquitin-conjugating enzyme E2 variant
MLDVVLCILAADFITGVIHWWEDTYGLPDMPIIGPAVIEPNIMHHLDQVHFTQHSVLYRNWQVFLAGAAGIVALWAAGWSQWQFTLTIALASMGNEVHAWTHKRPGRLGRLLQDMAIVITPHQHAKHHRPPFDTNFCTLTNVLNPLLDAVKFWWLAERAIALMGIEPKRMTPARMGV